MKSALLLFLACCLPVVAQDKAAENPQVCFAAQRLPKGLGEIVMVAGETRSDPFVLPMNNLSTSRKAPGRRFVILPDGSPTKLATVVLPATGMDFVVLLVVGDARTPFKPVVIPAKDASFKPGDVYMFNAAREKTVLGKVGTTRFMLAPAKGQVVRPAGAEGEGRFYNVLIGVREQAGDKVISTSRWPVDGRMRSYVFFFDDPKGRSVDFRAIDEFVPAEDPAGSGGVN